MGFVFIFVTGICMLAVKLGDIILMILARPNVLVKACDAFALYSNILP